MEGADLHEVFQALAAVQETQEKIERLREEGPLADPAALATLQHRLADELADVWFLIGGFSPHIIWLYSAGPQLVCSCAVINRGGGMRSTLRPRICLCCIQCQSLPRRGLGLQAGQPASQPASQPAAASTCRALHSHPSTTCRHLS
jgi:hypothetical protein